jgi:hypothetical protein
MLTGYEQVRSVVSAIAGDWTAARRVELALPDTGVCSLSKVIEPARTCCTPEPASACCTPAASDAARCC